MSGMDRGLIKAVLGISLGVSVAIFVSGLVLFYSAASISIFSLIVFLSLSTLFISFPLWWMLRRQAGRRKKDVEAAQSRAIVLTTQMLAHDVSKSAAMFQTVLSSVEKDDWIDSEHTVKECLSDLDQTMVLAHNKLQDLMLVGLNRKLSLQVGALSQVVLEAIERLSSSRMTHKMVCSVNLNHKYQPLMDKRRLGTVFSNILRNAVEHMPDQGDISVTSQLREGLIYVRIRNSGSYIEDSDISQVFDPFYTKGKIGGTGFGLTVAKKIIEGHGGTIWCSSSKDAGTEFVFTLMPSQIAEAGLVERIHHQSHSDKSTDTQNEGTDVVFMNHKKKAALSGMILVFEDESIFQRQWKKALKGQNHSVFANWKEFLNEAAQSFSWDQVEFVVTDFDLAVETGVDIAGRIRQKREDLPIFLSSNLPNPGEELVEIFDGVLSKDPTEALSQIKKIRQEGSSESLKKVDD